MRGGDGDQSIASRSDGRSTDSEIFAVPSSDYSDCEYCEERRRELNNKRSGWYQSPSATTSHHQAPATSVTMHRSETAPLLSPAPVYRSITTTSDSLGPGELSSNEILSNYNKRHEKCVKPERKKQSSLVTIFSVWNTVMGSSLLTMAWGVERAGLPAALALFAVMSAVCLYTAYVLLQVNYYHGNETCEVPALCRVLLGRGAEALAHAFSIVVLLGANVVYWILITNFLYFTVNYFKDITSNSTVYNSSLLCPRHDGVNGSLLLPAPQPDPAYWALHSTVPVYVAFIVFPLLNFKNVTFFTKFNSLGTLSVAYLVIFVLVKGYTWGVNVIEWAGARAASHAAVLSGMLALSFYIHNIIITIMSGNERQENNGRDLTIAFILVTMTYTMVGAVFYICFPLAKSCIEDNILNNFEMHDVMTAVARLLLLFQVLTVYPLVAYMLRTEAILLLPFKDSRWLTVTINVVIVAICILVACFCPSIGTIIRYTGAVSGLVHIFVLPPLLQLRSLRLRGRLTCARAAALAAIAAAGVVNLGVQFFIQDDD
ncbi:sodium-coupled neutral amino acid transporter 9 homolog [Pectinophora gossypiella]|uniref:sodium-coupled neutral amino acid transporter 9 homolog n=1 Tax=Pectinophora gossypiella TaxID=13191 RepID=UPI00214E689C|nr:sodium-coupled neutral amino acid transporter 9 homolog [Pectinophora gossypiella]